MQHRQLQIECDQAKSDAGIVSSVVQLATEYRRNLLIGCFLQIGQQLSGINVIVSYGPQILIDAGFENNSQSTLILIMLYVGVLYLAGTVLYYLIAARHGRRWLLLASTLPLGFAALTIAVVVLANLNGGPSVCKRSTHSSSGKVDHSRGVISVCRELRSGTINIAVDSLR